MDDDELDDYWEDDLRYEHMHGAGLSLYSFPPIAAIVVSVVMATLMINFARTQLSGIDLDSISFAAPGEPVQTLDQDPEMSSMESSNGVIAPLFTPTVQYWANDLLEWTRAWDIDPNLAATVMQIESCGHPDVFSSAGAAGLFQVMPFHFAPGEVSTDPDTNAYRGMSYLSRSLAAHNGDVYNALAGYNAGIGGSQRGEALWPAETKRYTYWGIGIYEDAAAGNATSARLDEWLASGGASLCRRAAEALGIAP